jgi:hypothetical protein
MVFSLTGCERRTTIAGIWKATAGNSSVSPMDVGNSTFTVFNGNRVTGGRAFMNDVVGYYHRRHRRFRFHSWNRFRLYVLWLVQRPAVVHVFNSCLMLAAVALLVCGFIMLAEKPVVVCSLRNLNDHDPSCSGLSPATLAAFGPGGPPMMKAFNDKFLGGLLVIATFAALCIAFLAMPGENPYLLVTLLVSLANCAVRTIASLPVSERRDLMTRDAWLHDDVVRTWNQTLLAMALALLTLCVALLWPIQRTFGIVGLRRGGLDGAAVFRDIQLHQAAKYMDAFSAIAMYSTVYYLANSKMVLLCTAAVLVDAAAMRALGRYVNLESSSGVLGTAACLVCTAALWVFVFVKYQACYHDATLGFAAINGVLSEPQRTLLPDMADVVAALDGFRQCIRQDTVFDERSYLQSVISFAFAIGWRCLHLLSLGVLTFRYFGTTRLRQINYTQGNTQLAELVADAEADRVMSTNAAPTL